MTVIFRSVPVDVPFTFESVGTEWEQPHILLLFPLCRKAAAKAAAFLSPLQVTFILILQHRHIETRSIRQFSFAYTSKIRSP